MTRIRNEESRLCLRLALIGNLCLALTLSPRSTSEFQRWPTLETSLSTPSSTTLLFLSPGYDEEVFVEDFEEDRLDDPSVASPLSQLRSDEEEALYRGTFHRNEQWLEDATNETLDLEKLPLGSLTEDDVESVTGLMAAWVRRRSVKAALVVEQLLKRVVDDMRANNLDAHVTTRMYTIAIDAWAKSGSKGGAQRAQHIHDGMIEMYKQTGDPQIAPSSISYNTLMNAWSKCSDLAGAEMVEKLLQDMIEWDTKETKPDSITFSTLMDTYARSNSPDKTRRAEQLFEMMTSLDVKRNVFTFSALQNVYARSTLPNAPEMTLQVLNRMIELSNQGDIFAKPNCVNYNAVLNAYSRTPSKKNAEKADQLLKKMELPAEDGGFDVEPDRLSYALTILACSRCPDPTFGALMAEANLEKMEERSRIEALRKEEISSAAPPSVRLDLECFNAVLTAISKSRKRDSVDRMIAIILRMEKYAEEGFERMRPNVRSWNAVLNALSRSKDDEAPDKAEQILTRMFELHENGVSDVRPDAFSFAAVLSAYQRRGTPEAIQRADDMVRRMEEMYEDGEIEKPPDVYHYTIVCAGWARSGQELAPHRCIQILSHMKERHRAGYPGTKPNVRTYNAVLDCLSRSNEADKAEQLLYHMLNLSRNGDEDATPDSFSFNSVIISFTRSNLRDAGGRAESVLDRFLEYSEEIPKLKPDGRSFTNIIAFYAKNKSMKLDAPYRAEYILNRMVSLFKSGHKYLEPNVFAVTTVMEAYAFQKHPDAGECAERLYRLVVKLRDSYGAKSLR